MPASRIDCQSLNYASIFVNGLKKGTYVFTVTATDNADQSKSDAVTITVNEAAISSTSKLAVAASGSDSQITAVQVYPNPASTERHALLPTAGAHFTLCNSAG
jgi:hypothetical protein